MLLAQRTTMARKGYKWMQFGLNCFYNSVIVIQALRYLRQISQEVSQPSVTGWGRRPAALRALSQRLSKGFNEAVNGFADDGWSMLESEGVDGVTLHVNSSPSKMMGVNLGYNNGFPSVTSSILCAKASILLRFLWEHRSERADSRIDAYSAAAIKAGPCSLPGPQAGGFGGQFMEVIKLENMGYYRDDMTIPGDVFLLQLCSGVDEHAIGTSAELIFAPIDASLSDDPPILPSGFRIIPLGSGTDAASPNRTLDLASALAVGTTGNKAAGDNSGHSTKSVMTIAFMFACEIHLQESIATTVRQYVRNIIASINFEKEEKKGEKERKQNRIEE
ncbi:unnamed protein product [Lupinus luteus]|uniref:Uncharacterized protein n=1 Tax=Lupinus luteus TaxID=3873 RepID=A0AAV1W933_LUPLU